MDAVAILKALEESINELALEFIQRPYNFYTETDMHLQLYAILQSKSAFEYVTRDGHHINLIHTEFPTFSRYRADEQHFFQRDPKGVRGAYDIVVWDPVSLAVVINGLAIWRPRFGEDTRPRLMAAIECKLYEGIGRYKTHIRNDLLKLTEPSHLIRRKYMVQFVRNMIYGRSGASYFQQLRQELKESIKTTDVKAKYVEVRKETEPINEWIGHESR